jgi:hypothetical protein
MVQSPIPSLPAMTIAAAPDFERMIGQKVHFGYDTKGTHP